MLFRLGTCAVFIFLFKEALVIFTRLDDQDHIYLLKAGDQAAFEELVSLFQSKVYNTCLGFLQNEEDAEDLCQEVFVAVFESIKDFKGESKLSTWIYRIAVTRSLEFLRKKKRKKRFAFLQSIFANEKGEIRVEALHFNHPGVQLEHKERAAILFGAIDQLLPNQKTAFLLHKIEGLSHAEISEIMKLSKGSVESLIVRAKQNLRGLLESYYYKNEL